MQIPQHIISLLSRTPNTIAAIRAHCAMDRSLADGIISSVLSVSSDAKSPSKALGTGEQATCCLRINPLIPIRDTYLMVFQRLMSWHVSISTQNAEFLKISQDINIFINALLDKIRFKDTVMAALDMVLKEGLCFMHIRFLENGHPHIELLSPTCCLWDQTSIYIANNMSASCGYFAFQQIVSFGTLKLRYNEDIVWQDISNDINMFSSSTYDTSYSNKIQSLNTENLVLAPQNKLCLITFLYEKQADGSYMQHVIFNGRSVIHKEPYQWLPILPLYMERSLERKVDYSYGMRSIASPVRQLLVSLQQLESCIFRYVNSHYPVRVVHAGALDNATSKDIEDNSSMSNNENLQNRLLKTTGLTPASDVFSVLYPPNLDPSLLQQYEFLLSTIYSFCSITPELLGQTQNTRDETASLFRSRNNLAVSRISPLLESCCNACVSLSKYLIMDLSAPAAISKMRKNKNLVKYFLTDSTIDPTQEMYEWEAIYPYLSLTDKKEFDTLEEMQGVSLSSLIASGQIHPKILAHTLPFFNKTLVESVFSQEAEQENQKNAMAAQQQQSAESVKILEIEERKAANHEKSEVQKLSILVDLLSKIDKKEISIDGSSRSSIVNAIKQLIE